MSEEKIEKTKKLYLFDIDGTLCSPRQPMTEEFEEKFLKTFEDKEFALVSGACIRDILNQIPLSVAVKAKLIFASSGNHVWANGVELHKYDFTPPSSLIKYLEFELENSDWTGERTGKHIDYRVGAINYSTIGIGSSQEVRDSYATWDRYMKERNRIRNYIISRYPRVECSIGGQVSVDIYEKGKGKEQLIDIIPSDTSLIFVGDKIYEGGNDYKLGMSINIHSRGCYYSVRSPIDTFYLLDELAKE